MADDKGEQQGAEQNERLASPAFLEARRYASEESSGYAYFQVQETLFKWPEPTDLSVYRVRVSPTFDWHVVVVGEATPAKRLRGKIISALSSGVSVQIPDDLIEILLERREQGKLLGGWSEKHYRPGRGEHYHRNRNL